MLQLIGYNRPCQCMVIAYGRLSYIVDMTPMCMTAKAPHSLLSPEIPTLIHQPPYQRLSSANSKLHHALEALVVRDLCTCNMLVVPVELRVVCLSATLSLKPRPECPSTQQVAATCMHLLDLHECFLTRATTSQTALPTDFCR